jgi:hypothetical protein
MFIGFRLPENALHSQFPKGESVPPGCVYWSADFFGRGSVIIFLGAPGWRQGIRPEQTRRGWHPAPERTPNCGTAERSCQRCVELQWLDPASVGVQMMLNPWLLGFEAVQREWQAQSALAFKLLRSFAGGVSDQTTSSPSIPDNVADNVKAQEEASAISPLREAAAGARRSKAAKATKVLRASKKISSHVKTRTVSKRAAAARQSSAKKAVRRSARKPR